MSADRAREIEDRARRAPASLIDHTLLRPEASAEEVARVCAEARDEGFAAVCVHGRWAAFARRRLPGAAVRLAIVIDFPLGCGGDRARRDAARAAWDEGADELDLVFDRGAFLEGDEKAAARGVEIVAKETPRGGLLKVILETGALADEAAKRRATGLALDAGADYLKTSTGFGPGGATVEDVRLLREVAGWERGVKASGGIRDAEAYRAMIAAGACRIGASAGISIVRGIGT